MLLDLSFDLVKLRRAGSHNSHGTRSVARQDADCDLLLPKQGMRAHAPVSQRRSELGDAQTLPLFFADCPAYMLRFHREDCSSLPGEILP